MSGAGWKAAGFAAKLAVSGVTVWALLRRIDLSSVRASLVGASPAWLALGLAALLLVPVIGGLRWWALLRGLGERGRAGTAVARFSVSALVGQVLPSVVGDGLRVWLTVRAGHRLGVAVRSVLLERVLMVVGLFALALATAPLLAARTGRADIVWLAAALFLASLGGLGLLAAADRIPARAMPWARLRAIAASADETRRALASRWGLLAAGLSLLGHLDFAVIAMLLGAALGVAATPVDFLAIMPAVTLATTLPISIGGWGVREGVLVLLLGDVGVPAGGALALSILLGVGGLLSAVPGTLAWALGRIRPAPAAAEAEAVPATGSG